MRSAGVDSMSAPIVWFGERPRIGLPIAHSSLASQPFPTTCTTHPALLRYKLLSEVKPLGIRRGLPLHLERAAAPMEEIQTVVNAIRKGQSIFAMEMTKGLMGRAVHRDIIRAAVSPTANLR